MQKTVSLLIPFVLFTIVGGVVLAQAAAALPTLAELEPGWNMLEPGGDTLCSNDTPYAFFVHPGDPNKLLFYLQGGGACWFGMACDPQNQEMIHAYDPFVDESDNPAEYDGIFDLENAENPFADYSIVMAAYCTADVHLGHRETAYTFGTREFTIFHNGYTNVSAVLDWTYANFAAPETIFVAGSSAGAIPSPFYGGLIAEHYPNAQIAVLGDAAGSYRGESIAEIMQAWGTLEILPDWEEYTGIAVEDFSPQLLYIASATRFPNVTFAQYNAAFDETQYRYLGFFNITDAYLPDLLAMAFTEIGGAVDNFRYYTAGGSVHTILGLPEFYIYQVNGVRFVDWITALAAGEPVENVTCTECDEAEIAAGQY